jgi:hypothetical protein
MQISELFTIEDRNQAVVDFLGATEVGKFPPIRRSGMERAEGLEALWRRWWQRDYTILCFFLSFLSFLSFTYLSFVSGDKG